MNDFRANDSLSEQIARHIGNLIVNGDLKAGDRIQELRIASELNVSRGSVREAYLILERRYLIEIVPRKGAVVAKLTPTHVKNLFELYLSLLGMLVRNLSQNWQGEDLQPFGALAQDMQKMVEAQDVRRFHDSMFEFVRLAYRFTENTYLIELLHNLQPAISRCYHLLLNASHDQMEATLRFMREALDNVAQRNADGAVQFLKACDQHLVSMVLQHLK